MFRKEVLESRADRLSGDVSLAPPISWQIIGWLLLAALAAALSFLFLGSYSRVENVTGIIVLDRGVVSIAPSRSGVITALPVNEGDRVQAGTVLAQVRAEEDLRSGGTAAERAIQSLGQQDERLFAQISSVMDASSAESERLVAMARGLSAELASLNQQIEEQRRLVELAEGEFRSAQSVAARGFISQRDLQLREGTLVSRRQQRAQLEQARASKSASLIEARQAISQARATAQAEAASIASSRAGLAQRRADVEATRGYTVRSPVAGRVTARQAILGEPANPQESLMLIVPNGARPQAELYVPTQASGFLAVGQEVRLAIDAFPYQRFGTVGARISEISAVAISRQTGDGGSIPVYLVTAELDVPWVAAFGRRQPLTSGMTFGARIVVERRSLFEWLFEPVYAVRNR